MLFAKDSIQRVNPGEKLILMKCFLKIKTGGKKKKRRDQHCCSTTVQECAKTVITFFRLKFKKLCVSKINKNGSDSDGPGQLN